MKRFVFLAGLVSLFFVTLSASEVNMSSVWKGKAKGIDGKEIDLSQYEGKVVMVVNVASKCGYTPQYKQMEEVYEKYKDQGFVLLGFPCNQFGNQEPGTEDEISKFCSDKFNVKFPMFSKVEVNGNGTSPLFKDLKAAKNVSAIKWNFEKFLINKKGEVVGHYLSKVSPNAPEVIKLIEAELKK